MKSDVDSRWWLYPGSPLVEYLRGDGRLMGFSINLLTLFGWILATDRGWLVDNAIIVMGDASALSRRRDYRATNSHARTMNRLPVPVVGSTLV